MLTMFAEERWWGGLASMCILSQACWARRLEYGRLPALQVESRFEKSENSSFTTERCTTKHGRSGLGDNFHTKDHQLTAVVDD